MSRGQQIVLRIFAFLLGAGLVTQAVLGAVGVIDTDGLFSRILGTVLSGFFGLGMLGVAIFEDFSKPPEPGPRAIGFHIGSGGTRFGVMDDDGADDIDVD